MLRCAGARDGADDEGGGDGDGSGGGSGDGSGGGDGDSSSHGDGDGDGDGDSDGDSVAQPTMWSPQVLNPNLNFLPFPTNGQFIRVAEVVGYIQHIV